MQEKIIFLYLLSNPFNSFSGVYRIPPGQISVGVDENQLEPTLSGAVDSLKILKSIDLIDYDFVNKILYIPDFHIYIPFGNGKPDIVGKQLLSHFKEVTYHNNNNIHNFWVKYINFYKEELVKLEKKLKITFGKKGNADEVSIQLILNLLNHT